MEVDRTIGSTSDRKDNVRRVAGIIGFMFITAATVYHAAISFSTFPLNTGDFGVNAPADPVVNCISTKYEALNTAGFILAVIPPLFFMLLTFAIQIMVHRVRSARPRLVAEKLAANPSADPATRQKITEKVWKKSYESVRMDLFVMVVLIGLSVACVIASLVIRIATPEIFVCHRIASYITFNDGISSVLFIIALLLQIYDPIRTLWNGYTPYQA
jgi:hypothetical protein